MKITRLKLENFRRLKDQEVRFTDNLNLIEGENNAGKSTIFYAIYFALTGEAFNFRSPKEYINFDEERMEVRLEFESGGGKYYVVSEYTGEGRGDYMIGEIGPDGEEVLESRNQGANVNQVREKVFGLAGLDKKTIEHVTYAAQKKFVDKVEGGTSQREAMDYIFDVKVIDALSDTIQKTVSQKKRRLEDRPGLEERREELEEEAEDFQDSVEELEQKIEGLEEELEQNTEKLEEIQQDIDEETDRYNELKKAKQLSNRLENRKELVDNLEEQLEELHAKYGDEPEYRIKELEQEIEGKKEQLEELEEQLERYGGKDRKIFELGKELEDVEKAIENKSLESSGLEHRIQELERKISGKLADSNVPGLETVESDLESVEESIEQAREDKARVETKLEGLQETHDRGECEVCGREVDNLDEYHGRIKQKEQELEEYRGELEECRERKERLQKLAVQIKELEKYRQELEELEDGLEKLGDRQEELEEEIEGLKEEMEGTGIEDLEQDRDGLKEAINDLQNRKERIEEGLEDLEKKESELEKHRELIQGVKDDIEELDVEYGDVKQELEAAEKAKNELEKRHAGLRTQVRNDREKLKELQEDMAREIRRLKGRREELEELEEELEELEELEKRVEEVEEALEVYSSSESEARDVNISRLESKVFKWYQELAARHEFKHLSIDREDYRLKGVPVNADREYSITDYQGGGQITLTALAYQLALAEVTGSDFLMVDEPTDATDSENRESLLEMIHAAVNQFSQILLITHHGVGREKADNIIKLEKLDDGRSKVRYPLESQD